MDTTLVSKIIDALICDKDRYSGGVHPSLYVSPLFCLICNVIHILLVYLSIFYVAYTRIISLEVSSGPKKIATENYETEVRDGCSDHKIGSRGSEQRPGTNFCTIIDKLSTPELGSGGWVPQKITA